METTIEGQVLFNLLTQPAFWAAYSALTTAPEPAPTQERLQALFRDGFFSSDAVMTVVHESAGEPPTERLYDLFTDLDFWGVMAARTGLPAPTPTEPRLEALFGKNGGFFATEPVAPMVDAAIHNAQAVQAVQAVQLVGVVQYVHEVAGA